MRIGDLLSLKRGTTYQGRLVGRPGPALLGLGSIVPGGGFRADYRTYGGECPADLMLSPGDLYVSLKGATKDGEMIGSVARVPPTVPSGRLTQDTVRLVFASRDLPVERFVYWLLRSPHYRTYCAARATGSAVVALSREDFLNYPVPEFTSERQVVVETLETIEAKIDLNRRMSETLEEMATAVFRAWFVDFEPVRDNATGKAASLPVDLRNLFPSTFQQDERLGEIPEAWTTCSLGDASLNFDSKRVPLSSAERAKRPGPFPYHGATGVMDHVDAYLFDGVYLLIGEDGSVVKDDGTAFRQYVSGRFWVNNHAHVLQGKGPFSTEYLYLLLGALRIAPYVTGAVQAKLSQGRMNSIPIVKPAGNVCRAFSQLVAPWFSRISLLAQENETLATLRDLLLPKLISGELRIKDAEKIVETAPV
jgi:restriction endonuclease S subunit